MRDVVTDFYCGVLRKQIDAKKIAISDSVLVVCGGPLDEAVMREVGFANFTVTGFNHAGAHQDAENLTYGNGSFDIVIVHVGLHHCYSPHRALLEMYRVARKQVLAFESRDSFLMRMAVRLGLTIDYEIDSAIDGKGGVAESGIPNFVYRWTEREVEKVIASFDPTRPPKVDYFYDLRVPVRRYSSSGNHALAIAGRTIEPMSRVFAAMFPRQSNEFAFVISKIGVPHHWIK
jgi:SAM-dependent methyltransferase